MRISRAVKGTDKVGGQLAECRELAERQGYEVVPGAIYEDDGISATSGKTRPGWEQLLTDVEAGQYDVLLAVEESRFHRGVGDQQRLVVACLGADVTWHTVRDGIVNPADAAGEFLATLRAAMARQEVRRKSERQASGIRAAREAGKLVGGGVRPFGYLKQKKDRTKAHPVEGPEVTWAYAHVVAGGSLGSVARRWNDRGIKTSRGNRWGARNVQQVLLRVNNCGRYSDGHGRIREGVVGGWDALVDVETWEAVHARLHDSTRRLVPLSDPVWLLSGIARCVCGETMRTGNIKTASGDHPTYRCNLTKVTGAPGRHTTARCRELDALVRDELVRAVRDAATSAVGNVADGSPARLQALLETRRGQIRARLVELGDDLADVAIPRAMTRDAIAKLTAEQDDVDTQLRDLRAQSAHAFLVADLHAKLWGRADGRVSLMDAADVTRVLGERFDALELRQRQELVKAFLWVTVLPGRTPDRLVVKRLADLQPGETPEVLSYP
ncbi:hypothetical protein ASG36_14685 [Geodermatophilus sp. Leaf369]|nr:hypothetical protein ASG36_14685 [Geodermatophilus sp. Leaf369]